MLLAKSVSTQQQKNWTPLHPVPLHIGFMLGAAAGSGYTLSTLLMSRCRMKQTAVRNW